MSDETSDNEGVQELREEQFRLEQAFQRTLALCRTRAAIYPDRAIQSRLCKTLHELCDHLGMLIAIKESGGYLTEEVVRAPELGEQVEALGHEWEHLYESVCQLVEMAERHSGRKSPVALLKAIELCCDELRREYRHDETVEQEIVSQVFNVDIGGEA